MASEDDSFNPSSVAALMSMVPELIATGKEIDQELALIDGEEISDREKTIAKSEAISDILSNTLCNLINIANDRGLGGDGRITITDQKRLELAKFIRTLISLITFFLHTIMSSETTTTHSLEYDRTSEEESFEDYRRREEEYQSKCDIEKVD